MNSTELLTEVRRLWLGPQTTLLSTDDDDLLAHADRVIEEELYPKVVDLMEEFFIWQDRFTLASGTTHYRIPPRAYNGQIREISFLADGTQRPVPLRWINRSEKDQHGQLGGLITLWYTEGDFFVPIGDPSGSIDLAYPLAPSKLVTADNCRQVVTVTPATRTVTLDQSVPSDWVINSTEFDLIQQNQTGMPNEINLTASVLSGTTVTFNQEIDGSTTHRFPVEVGNYLCVAGETVIPRLPVGLHGVIVHGVASRVAQSQGDQELYGLATAEFARHLQEQMVSIDQRYEGIHVPINFNSRFRRWGSSGLGRGRRRIF